MKTSSPPWRLFDALFFPFAKTFLVVAVLFTVWFFYDLASRDYPDINYGDRVRVTSGFYEGLEGVAIETSVSSIASGPRFLLEMDNGHTLIMQSLCLEVIEDDE